MLLTYIGRLAVDRQGQAIADRTLEWRLALLGMTIKVLRPSPSRLCLPAVAVGVGGMLAPSLRLARSMVYESVGKSGGS